MINNKYIALIILVILIAGMLAFAVFRSPLGVILTLAGVISYFVLNKKE